MAGLAVDDQAVLPGVSGGVRLVSLRRQPVATGSEVLVRMLYAPINPADLLVIEGRSAFALDKDAPIGAEGVGVVERVGADVSDLSLGDMVLPLSRGNWCRYRVVQRSELVAVPASINPVQAAMLRINPPTARLLVEAAGVGQGDILLQNAATSAVAAWVRAITARMGVTVIDIVRRPDPALPYAVINGPDLAERIKLISRGRPVCAALDCVAGAGAGQLAECLAPNGRLIVFGHLSGRPVTVPSQLLTGGGLTIAGFSLRPAEAALGKARRARIFADLLAIASGDGFGLPVREIVPLSRVEEGIAMARQARPGRVLLDLST